MTRMSAKDLLTVHHPASAINPAASRLPPCVFRSDDPVILRLPIPPSVNNLFHTLPGKGRAKSKHYVKWIRDAGWMLRAARPRAVHGWYIMQVELPESYRADIDNSSKAVNDLLKTHGIIDDDRWCWSILITRVEDIDHCKVTVTERENVFSVEAA